MSKLKTKVAHAVTKLTKDNTPITREILPPSLGPVLTRRYSQVKNASGTTLAPKTNSHFTIRDVGTTIITPTKTAYPTTYWYKLGAI